MTRVHVCTLYSLGIYSLAMSDVLVIVSYLVSLVHTLVLVDVILMLTWLAFVYFNIQVLLWVLPFTYLSLVLCADCFSPEMQFKHKYSSLLVSLWGLVSVRFVVFPQRESFRILVLWSCYSLEALNLFNPS